VDLAAVNRDRFEYGTRAVGSVAPAAPKSSIRSPKEHGAGTPLLPYGGVFLWATLLKVMRAAFDYPLTAKARFVT
jgi:hypothetical protein